jgi:hypothetical protein
VSGRRLSPAWRLQASIAAVILAPAVHAVHMDRLTRWVRWWAGITARRAPVHHDALADWVDRFLGSLPWPWHRTCLKRGITLFYLLAAARHPVTLAIGVRRASDGELQAHAWLTDQGTPYLERSENVRSFAAISQFA